MKLELALIAEMDITDSLKPGVYTLALHGRVVYVGRTTGTLLDAIQTHRSVNSTPALARLFPGRRIAFDSVTIYPCASDRQRDLVAALETFHNLRSPPPPAVHSQPTRRL